MDHSGEVSELRRQPNIRRQFSTLVHGYSPLYDFYNLKLNLTYPRTSVPLARIALCFNMPQPNQSSCFLLSRSVQILTRTGLARRSAEHSPARRSRQNTECSHLFRQLKEVASTERSVQAQEILRGYHFDCARNARSPASNRLSS